MKIKNWNFVNKKKEPKEIINTHKPGVKRIIKRNLICIFHQKGAKEKEATEEGKKILNFPVCLLRMEENPRSLMENLS